MPKTKDRREELRGMAEADMNTAIADAHKSIYQFRKDRLGKPQENVKVVKAARKEIARILTFKRQRELSGETQG